MSGMHRACESSSFRAVPGQRGGQRRGPSSSGSGCGSGARAGAQPGPVGPERAVGLGKRLPTWPGHKHLSRVETTEGDSYEAESSPVADIDTFVEYGIF